MKTIIIRSTGYADLKRQLDEMIAQGNTIVSIVGDQVEAIVVYHDFKPIPQYEKNCENCVDFHTILSKDPCANCDDFDQWRPQL